MLFKQSLLHFALGYAFLVLLVLTYVIVPKAKAQTDNSDATSETASYQGLQDNDFMKTWLVLGAVPVFEDKPDSEDEETQKKAFAADFLTQHGGEDGIQPKPGLAHKIGDEEYQWQLIHSENDIINLIEIYGKKEFVVAYAWAEIEMSETTKMLLGIGSDDGVKIWLNGELIHENWVGRPLTKDDDLVPATFKKGKNQLLLKIQNGMLDWSFTCRKLGSESLTEKLIAASGMGNLDDLELLLSHGADVNAEIGPGLTALHYAKINGREDAVEFLVKNGADPNIEIPAKEKLVDFLFEPAIERGNTPGAAALIAQDGEILYEKGYGFANLEHQVPITSKTKFRIGSITKQFTATAILKLQEEGKLSVNDPLSKFISDYPRGDEVTIHHLLTHTSGIHSYTGKPDFFETVTVEVKPEELIESFKNDKFDFDPGEKWLYNNSGYVLLGYIVEKVSGESFADYLKNHLFESLGMKDTGIHHWRPILEHEAAGYSYVNGEFQKSLDWDMSRAGGAGALYSTIGDLYRWNEAIFNGKVLNESSLEAAFTPVKLNNGSEANAMGGKYGYGWMLSEMRGLKEISHGGGLHGFSTYLTRYPKKNVTVTVLTNCGVPPMPELNSSASARDIAQIYLWEQMPARESFATDTTVDASVYDDYVGRYDYGGAILTVTKEGDRLFAQLTGQPKFEIFPNSETEFFLKVVDAQITFAKNEEGEVTHVIHRQGGQEFEAPRLKDEIVANVDSAVYDAYVGEYDYGNSMILNVTKENDKLFAQMTGQPKFEIFPRSETEFSWKVVNAQITFVKNEDGKVTKAVHHQGGMEIEAPKIK